MDELKIGDKITVTPLPTVLTVSGIYRKAWDAGVTQYDLDGPLDFGHGIYGTFRLSIPAPDLERLL